MSQLLNLFKSQNRKRRTDRTTWVASAQVLEQREMLTGLIAMPRPTLPIQLPPVMHQTPAQQAIQQQQAFEAARRAHADPQAQSRLQQYSSLGLNFNIPGVISFGTKTGHELKQIDSSFPVPDNSTSWFQYAEVKQGLQFTFGSITVSASVGTPISVIVDGTSDSTPFIYGKYGSFAAGFDLGGGIAFTANKTGAAPPSSLNGNLYFAGDIQIPETPITLTGEAVFKLPSALTSRLQSRSLALQDVVLGKCSATELLSGSGGVGVNGTARFTPEFFKGAKKPVQQMLANLPITADVEVSGATFMMQNSASGATSLMLVGGTNSIFNGSYLDRYARTATTTVSIWSNSSNSSFSALMDNIEADVDMSSASLTLGSATLCDSNLHVELRRDRMFVSANINCLSGQIRVRGEINPRTGDFTASTSVGIGSLFASLPGGMSGDATVTVQRTTTAGQVVLGFYVDAKATISNSTLHSDASFSASLSIDTTGYVTGSLSYRVNTPVYHYSSGTLAMSFRAHFNLDLYFCTVTI